METQLATDSTLSGLDLLFKEQLVTDQNIVLKVSGVFSTVSGLREYAGSLHKYFSFGRSSSSGSSGRNSYKRDKGLFKLGAGVSYRQAPSRSAAVYLVLVASCFCTASCGAPAELSSLCAAWFG